MRLLINNLANASNTTVTSEDADFPVGNQYNNYLIEQTKLPSSQLIDLGSVQTVNAVGLVYSGTANITLGAGSTTSANDVTFNITDTVTFIAPSTTGDNNLITGQGDNRITGQGDNRIVQLASTYNYRYWKLTADAEININHFYLGSYLQITGILADTPITPQFVDTDVSITSVGGQQYSTTGVVLKSYPNITVTDGDGAQYQSFNNWWLTTDRIKNFLFVPFENSLTTYPFEPFFARLTNPTSPVRKIDLHHEWTFTITEVK